MVKTLLIVFLVLYLLSTVTLPSMATVVGIVLLCVGFVLTVLKKE